MRRTQKLLILVILTELVILSVMGLRRFWVVPRPMVNVLRFHRSIRSELENLGESLDRDSASDWIELANQYRAFGLLPEAEYCYSSANDLSPRNPMYIYQWGLCLDRLGRIEESRQRYRQAIEQGYPQVPECWMQIADGYLRQEEAEAAEIALRQALDLPQANLKLARVLIRVGRAEEAAQMLDDLLRTYPHDLHANQLRSFAATALKKPREAADYEDRVLRGRAELLRVSAYKDLSLMLKYRSNVGTSRLHRQNMELQKQGKLDEALRILRAGAELRSTTGSTQQLADLEMKLGRPRTAVDLLEKLIKRLGLNATTLNLLGDARFDLAQYDHARSAWLRAARMYPDAILHHKLADVFRRAGEPQQAERHEGLKLYAMGKEAWLKNELSDAKTHLQAATQLIEDHAHAWFYLAESLRLLGQAEQARRAYQRCLAVNPDHGRALRGIARIDDDAGRS